MYRLNRRSSKVAVKKPAIILALIVAGSTLHTGALANLQESRLRFFSVRCPDLVPESILDEALLPKASPPALIDHLAVDLVGVEGSLEYRLKNPGPSGGFGPTSVTSAVTLGGSKELHAWFSAVEKGLDIRKNIAVHLLGSEKQRETHYVMYDCFPVRWSARYGHGEKDTSSTVSEETITVKVERIDFKV